VLYLLAQRLVGIRIPLLVLFGVIFFFALKMKESGIVIGALLLGFGFESDNRYGFRRLLQSCLWVLAGMLIGQIIFMILDHLILGDALFGLRPENWQALLTFNLREEYQRLAGNYFQSIAGTEMLVLSLFALLAAAWQSPQKKVLWLLPVATVGFLTVSMISGAWYAIPRYALIVTPVLSVLAACYFYVVLSRSSHSTRWLMAGLVVGFIVAQGIVVPWAITRYNWDGEDFRRAILMPVTLLSVGLLAATLPSRHRAVLVGWSLCVGLLLIPPAVQVFHDLNNGFTTGQGSKNRWLPYVAFASLIQPSNEMRLLTSPSLNADYGYAGRTYEGDRWMFDLYFRANLAESQFVQEPVTRQTLSQVQPTYVLMTVDDWRNWSDADQLAILDQAQVFAENRQRLILINYGTPAAEVQPAVHWFPLAAGYRNCRIVTGEAEPGVYEFQCHPPEGDNFTILGWTYLAGDGSIGASVAEGSAATGDQLKQMAYSFEVYPDLAH